MKSPRLRLRVRLWLAIILLMIGISLLILSSIPGPRIQQVLPMPQIVLPTPTSLILDWRGV